MRGKASITYTDSRGNVFDLMVDDFRRIATASFHEYSWQRETTPTRFGEKLRAWKKDAAQYAVTIYFDGSNREQHLNEFHDALEYDVYYNSPGTLTWEEYSIECYGISSKTYPSANALNAPTANDVVFYCPSPWWKKTTLFSSYATGGVDDIEVIRVSETVFNDEDGNPITPAVGRVYKVINDGDYKGHRFIWNGSSYEDLTPFYCKMYNYSYDYPYDYTINYQSFVGIFNESVTGCSYVAIIYGPIDSPYISIVSDDGQTNVSINTMVPEGAKLIVDSTDKTIVKILADGTIENAFAARNLDAGYLWNRIPHGENKIVWDGSFKFDLMFIEERSEPKWLLD